MRAEALALVDYSFRASKIAVDRVMHGQVWNRMDSAGFPAFIATVGRNHPGCTVDAFGNQKMQNS
jgi:hypothetical protein